MFNAQEYFEGRGDKRCSFLKTHLRAVHDVLPLAEDWASRRYFRVREEGGRSFVLMEAIPDHTGHFTPGHKLSDFIRINKALRSVGIRAPEIIAADESEGYLLLEDFGDVSVYAALDGGENPARLYERATDVLVAFRDRLKVDDLALPEYYEGHIHKGRQRIVDWYVPATRREKNRDGLLESYLFAWNGIEKSLPPCPVGFVHGDFHAQNLMLLPGGMLGVLDFQGALRGPLPYDLANLIEDIRRDVPADIHAAMLERYGGDDCFLAWFRVLATQFHCRILGQVLRLAIIQQKTDFLKFIPRVQHYIRKALNDPVLAPLAQWMKEERIDLTVTDCFDPERVRLFIREDAF